MELTTRLKLKKPDGNPETGDYLDVDVLNQNADKVDSVISFTMCSSTTRPGVPFQGQAILETDTGKAYVWGGSSWLQLLIGTAAFDSQVRFSHNIGVGDAPDPTPARRIRTWWGGTMGGVSQVLLEQSGPAAGSRALGVKAGLEANERWWIDFDGRMQWGPGTAGADLSLWRQGAFHGRINGLLSSSRPSTGDLAFGAYVDGDTNPRAALTNGGEIQLTPAQGASSRAVSFNHGYAVFVDNAGAGSAANRWWLDTPSGGEVIIGPRGGSSFLGQIRLRTNATTSLGANTVLDGDILKKSTSSIRYKVNVEDVDWEQQLLLQLRPVKFNDRREHEEKGDSARQYVGLIAEEVHELGLTEFVYYDEQNRPDGVQYDRLTVALLSIVKDLAERVARLEEGRG